MTRYILPLLLLILVGCNGAKEEKLTSFGGKIINPKSKFVLLTDHDKFTDTIPLKSDNTFNSRYKNLKEGLYFFQHGPEHQYVYIEPKDSILIRLNTWDFDESLVFSGDNAEKNNALIEIFLDNEIDKKFLYETFELNSNLLKEKTDSLLQIKDTYYNSYKNNFPETSERFLSLLKIALTHQPYIFLEKSAIKNCLKKTPEKLVDNYFDYRENVNRSLDSIMFYYPYNQLVISSIYNDVYQKGVSQNSENITLELLNSINSNIKDEQVRNRLLFNTTVKHFFSETCNYNSQKTLYTFFKFSTSIDDKKEIQRLINDTKKIKKGDQLPSFELIAPTGEMVDVSKFSKGKKTVIYFKNHKFSSDEYVSSRINHLIKTNPKINFLIVNSCKNASCFTKDIDIKNQVRLSENSKAKEFLSSKFSRMILVDEKGIVKNGYTSLSSEKLNDQIANLEKH
ncbi:hypothetical protein [uncultured Tenacibaculum sp.]|uniref:hypothetical protein n=1 Tax=uncultured Tenacibaculum sp. TaxID=174713 RepID=UPI00261F44B0|nr:hypothetical protein [uncultured Tenacibaculum sp.]